MRILPAIRAFSFGFLAWNVVVALVCFLWTERPWASFGWALGIGLLCFLDILCIAAVVRPLLAIVAGTSGRERSRNIVQIFVCIPIKLACLGLLAVVLWAGRDIPNHALLLGSGTLVAVPLVGGLIWFKKEEEKKP